MLRNFCPADVRPLPPHNPPRTLTHICALTRLAAGPFASMRRRLAGRDFHLRGLVGRCHAVLVGLQERFAFGFLEDFASWPICPAAFPLPPHNPSLTLTHIRARSV